MTQLENIYIASGNTETCAATVSVQVEDTVNIDVGGKAKVISPKVMLMPQVTVSDAAELEINARSPMP